MPAARSCAVCGGSVILWARPCGDWSYDRCQVCGHVELRQRPSREELQRYYDAIYEYSEERFAGAVARRYVKAVEDGAIHALRRPRRILEVGCNTGVLLVALRERGWQVAGTELSRRFRAVAHSRGLEVRTDLRDWIGEQFDIIVCFHVIEHMPDVNAELGAMRKLLRAPGVLAIKTPNATCLAARLFPNEWEWSSPPAHLRLFTPASLRRSIEAAGFDVLRLATERGNARPLPFQAMRALAIRLRGRARRFTPGLDHRHVPIAHQLWYRSLEGIGGIVGALGAPFAPVLRRLSLLPELTAFARISARAVDGTHHHHSKRESAT